jgi:uncharacterized membrane protein
MKKSLNKDTIINIAFYGGMLFKAVNALIEFLGGIVMIALNHESINSIIELIALPELRQDPNDVLMNYLITLGQNLSIGSQHSIAVYMLLHGSIKMAAIYLLWNKKIWAYKPAAAVFALFVAYEAYSFAHSKSLLMLLIIIIDAAIIALIILEYKRLKAEKTK